MAQIKSEERIAELGEVFTNEKEVNAMLDLVQEEVKKISSTVLEPACGTGNFLVEILKRKLSTVNELYQNNEDIFITNAILALSSIYGIDIMEDNIEESKQRMLKIFEDNYQQIFNKPLEDKVKKMCNIILNANIIQGNSLTGSNKYNDDIIIYKWEITDNRKIKRTKNKFNDLIK